MNQPELPSPAKNLLWRIRTGATLWRGPLKEGRRCYVVERDGSMQLTYPREIRVLESHGLIFGIAPGSKNEPTKFELTEAGKAYLL